MPSAKNVSSLIDFQHWKLDTYAEKMGTTLKSIHSCEPEKGVFPSTSEIYQKYALRMKKYFNDSEIQKIIDIIKSIPEKNNIVCGNFHSGNVFVHNDELLVLNLSGMSCGNPIFDLGFLYLVHVLEANWLSKKITGLDFSYSKRFWDCFIRAYLSTDDTTKISKSEKIIGAAALICLAVLPAMNSISEQDSETAVRKTRYNFFQK